MKGQPPQIPAAGVTRIGEDAAHIQPAAHRLGDNIACHRAAHFGEITVWDDPLSVDVAVEFHGITLMLGATAPGGQ
jgi:uncharacterized Zn-binding protein involved in type VI secretion